MARLGRKGRILKWAGVIVSALIVVLWTTSLFWGAWYESIEEVTPSDFSGCHVGIGYGRLALFYGSVSGLYAYQALDSLRALGRDLPDYGVSRIPWYGWDNLVWMPRDPWAGTEKTRPGRPWTWSVEIPLWVPFVLIAIPTAVLWWRDRRRIPPGHCQKCGYNLTGNVSGACPECGEKILPKRQA